MALQGTIKDFGLPDIFQLIGIQRKTGILTLDSGKDSVTLKFLDGQVVGADTRTETLEDRLGRLLVRTGRITEAQLQEALRGQENTLQRLGHILVTRRLISEADLVDALRVQSTQIIYRLFRWREGTYKFDSVEDLDYDQRHFTPISSETILMEGARMMDEWPIIERRVRSSRMVLRRTEAAYGLDLGEHGLLEQPEFDLGFDRDVPPADPGEAVMPRKQIRLSSEETSILRLVDGRRAVDEICDLCNLGEFDCYRILSDLLTRNLVEEICRADDAAREREATGVPDRLLGWLLNGTLAAVVVLGLFTLPSNPITPWRLSAGPVVGGVLPLFASLARVERLQTAIQVFYLDAGTFPRSLSVLAQNGYLDPDDLLDPWGRPYHYQLSPGGYQLVGFDAAGEPSPELTVSHRFNPVQQMMLAGGPDAGP